ncbi:MAG: hypothetical protein KBO59_23985 [Achromobacter sp.]|nr:hypothetical protein [Achromobacter sp.]
MKTITLHTACASNGGTRIGAGETVAVGTKPDQIAPDRARALVNGGSAVAVPGAGKADTGEEPAKRG